MHGNVSRVIISLCLFALSRAALADDKKSPPPANAATAAKATFDAKFNEVKAAYADIEKLTAQFQTADPETRKKLNATLTGQISHAQTLVNEMVEAGEAAYRAAPNADPAVTDVLLAVAKHYTIGRQIGPGEPSRRNPQDIYYPIEGGDQYERALPIIKLLIDGGAKINELYVYGFLSAFMTNDYDLAKTYLDKAKQSGILSQLADDTTHGDQAGVMRTALHTVAEFAPKIDECKELWEQESKIRAAEAKADNLPRVKLTTTKGVITVELFENEAPQTVANFLTLVKQGYYNGSPFHRVLPEFMAQTGAKTEDGNGGPDYTIRDEFTNPNYRRHFRGTISMANTGQRESGSSQFFLTFIPTMHLNGRHTAFGRVIDGIEVLGDLQHRSIEHQQNPPEPDRILKAEVIRDRGHSYKFERLPEK